MTVRLAINGFGRIGRNVVRSLIDREVDVEIVAVNDLGNLDTLAHLLRYDSVHGSPSWSIETNDSGLELDGRKVEVLSERDPAALPWRDLGVDVVIESTGVFTKREGASKHLEAGAKRVIISAPSGDCDATYVVGVNDNDYDPATDVVISNASCTTNCLAPMVKVLDDNFGVENGMITTVHAYTGDQAIVDGPHRDLRRARAAAVNVVPTSTGAAKAIGLVLPHLAGKLDGMAVRVPIPNGSITDFVGQLKTPATVDEVNEAFRAAAESGPLASVLEYSTAPLVSSDIVGSPASCIFDSGLTLSMGNTVKIGGWYDTEWGYANRLVDLVVRTS
jgi:glyceraldehyde 3-phosphate dehydrogenase